MQCNTRKESHGEEGGASGQTARTEPRRWFGLRTMSHGVELLLHLVVVSLVCSLCVRLSVCRSRRVREQRQRLCVVVESGDVGRARGLAQWYQVAASTSEGTVDGDGERPIEASDTSDECTTDAH